MKKTELFVLDTNTLISAFILPKSIARQALNKARKMGRIAFSKATADEFKGVFVRPKFDKYLALNIRIEIIASFDYLAQYVAPKHVVADCRDPKDNKFLELALSANAGFIITGDQDLLTLDPFRGIRILSAKDFIEN